MVAIGIGGVPDDLGIDPRATPEGMFQAFQNIGGSTLAHHKAVSIHVKGTGGRGRVIVPRRQGTHDGKAGKGHRRKRGLGSATNSYLCAPTADHLSGIADGLGTRGASRDRRAAIAPEAKSPGNLKSGHVGWQ